MPRSRGSVNVVVSSDSADGASSAPNGALKRARGRRAHRTLRPRRRSPRRCRTDQADMNVRLRPNRSPKPTDEQQQAAERERVGGDDPLPVASRNPSASARRAARCSRPWHRAPPSAERSRAARESATAARDEDWRVLRELRLPPSRPRPALTLPLASNGDPSQVGSGGGRVGRAASMRGAAITARPRWAADRARSSPSGRVARSWTRAHRSAPSRATACAWVHARFAGARGPAGRGRAECAGSRRTLGSGALWGVGHPSGHGPPPPAVEPSPRERRPSRDIVRGT